MPGRKKMVRSEPQELIARTLSCERNYYIGRMDWTADTTVSDEAALEVEAIIEQLSKPLQKHIDKPISFRLLHAETYPPRFSGARAFFGSITLRGNERHALAYLPGPPFWALADLISEGAEVIDASFETMRQGHGDLLSLYFGRRDDLDAELRTSPLTQRRVDRL